MKKFVSVSFVPALFMATSACDGQVQPVGLSICTGADCFSESRSSSLTCESTGGRWDDAACGNSDCGSIAVAGCAAEEQVGGCQCPEGSIYLDDLGCVPTDNCGRAAACAATGGRPRLAAAGTCRPVDQMCGVGEPLGCDILDEDLEYCDCGMNGANDADGCFSCTDMNMLQASCAETGGSWDPVALADYECGVEGTYVGRPYLGGCNCGPGSAFVDGRCVQKSSCGAATGEEH